MSGLDQPMVIANSCYHVGHERTWLAAEEQGFVKEEGLENYVYQRGGLIPGEWEFVALGRQMWERGVDIATAVDVRAAVMQRARGEDVYIVGGWRIQLAAKLIGAKGITRPEQLRGGKSIVREKWGLNHIGMVAALRKFGVGPDDIDWMERPLTGYGGDANIGDSLRSGEVSFLPLNGQAANQLMSEGYPLVLDLADLYIRQGAWPPGKVIVATAQTIERRGEELRAALRANLRAFWFTQDPRNHTYMYDLENRQRQATFNEDERRLRRLRDTAPPPLEEDPSEMGGTFAMDGLVARPALAGVIDGLVESGELEHPIDVDDALKDAASIDACQRLLDRGLIDAQKVAQWRSAKGIQAAAAR